MRGALYLARQDLRILFRDWAVWVWAFAMPVAFFYFLGTVTGRSFTPPAAPALTLSAPPDAGWLAGHLKRRLEERGYRVNLVEGEARSGRVLKLPNAFTESVLGARPVELELSVPGEGLSSAYDRIRIQRAVYTVLADLVAAGRDGRAPSQEALAALAEAPRRVTVEAAAAGKRRDPPRGFEQSVPGAMVMFTLLVMFTAGAVSLTQERRQGVLRRLASSPLPRGAVVAGKLLARLGLGLIQVSFGVLAGSLLFGVKWGPHYAALAAVLVAYAVLAALLGMLLGNFARTEGQTIALGVVLTNVLAALGGCWWPVEITPRWAQALAAAIPTGWTMDALHRLLSFGDGPAAVLPHLGALAGAAAVCGFVLARRFRFS